jgi:brefeldin A-inhibited guanine nucleotide-exchange protein
MAWRPVVVDVMEAYTNFPGPDFERHINTFYPLAVELLSRDVGIEVRLSLQSFLRRVGEIRFGLEPSATPSQTPTSPGGKGFFERRSSLRTAW